MPVPHASLKVYEPIESFEAEEQQRYRALASTEAAAAPGRGSSIVISRTRGLVEAGTSERADVIEVKGGLYVCPHRTRLRLLAALVAFRRMIPAEVAEAFMPPGEVERALTELESIRAEHPDWRSHILSSTWEVPVRWFVAFDDEEREVDASMPMLRYRTSMVAARERTAEALEAVESAVIGQGVAALVSDLARWLEIFHQEAVVELDYGGIAGLVPPAELRRDRSARDIRSSVEALAAGDVLRATGFYMRAIERWAPLAGRERTN
ncbi:MAG: hypothetical protein ACRDJM_01835 [Actinomycetota bacterium]